MACADVPPFVPGNSRRFAPTRSGWVMATGPSSNPMTISRLPLVRSISGFSATLSRGFIQFHHLGMDVSLTPTATDIPTARHLKNENASQPSFPRPSPQGPPAALPYPILRRLSSTSHRRAVPRSAWLRATRAGGRGARGGQESAPVGGARVKSALNFLSAPLGRTPAGLLTRR